MPISQLCVGASLHAETRSFTFERAVALPHSETKEHGGKSEPQIRNQRTRRTDNTGLPHSIDSTPFWGSEGQLPQPLTKF